MPPTTANNSRQDSSASRQKNMGMSQTRLILKGFIRKVEEGSYEGIRLTLNLPVRGGMLEETERKLSELTAAYLEGTAKNGTWNELVPRHAPASYYATYYRYAILSHFTSLMDFKLFVQFVPRCAAHAQKIRSLQRLQGLCENSG
jgi:hypothetical protein